MQATARVRTLHQSRRTQGFSLIELMVSLTIGLVIAIAAMSAYLGAAGAGRMSEAQSRMNEDAQAALNILAQQIRMVGTNPVQPGRDAAFRHNPVYEPTYVGGTSTTYGNGTAAYVVSAVGSLFHGTNAISDFTTTAALSAFSIRGCDGPFTNITTVSNLDSFSNCGTSTLPDSIAVSYEADRYNTVPSGSSPTDCVGSAIPTTVIATFNSSPVTTGSFAVADNRFYITNTASVTSLHCKGIGSATQPLVENVEDLQLTYGTISTTNLSATATVAGYLDAAGVVALAPTADVAGWSAAWGKVQTVRICVVIRSDGPVVTDAASGQYYKCDGTLDTSKTDLRLRRAYSTTVVLRNRRY